MLLSAISLTIQHKNELTFLYLLMRIQLPEYNCQNDNTVTIFFIALQDHQINVSLRLLTSTVIGVQHLLHAEPVSLIMCKSTKYILH